MENELFTRMYNGRFELAEEIENNVPNLEKDLVEQAKSIKADLFVVSALGFIKDPVQATNFKETIYPLEIAKIFFPSNDYRTLEVFALDVFVGREDCGLGRTHQLTPKIIANRGINTAYNNVYEVVLKDKERLNRIREIWGIESYY